MFSGRQKKEYLDALGNICPYCHSSNINALGSLECDDDGTADQEVECYDCGRLWKDIYTLTGLVHEDKMS
jgi:hypothetical protein